MGTTAQFKLWCAQRWGQKLSSNAMCRDAVREAFPPLPSLARALPCDTVTVMRFPPTASQTQARMAEVASGKAVPNLSPLCFILETHTTGLLPSHTHYRDIQSQCFQRDGLKEVLLLKVWIGTEVPQLSSGRWQDWCSSVETQVLTRRLDPHILAPASANILITEPKPKNLSWGDNDT